MESKLAKNIRYYRKSLGLTQEQIAERRKIALGTVPSGREAVLSRMSD